jgi:hypothetical protein
MSVRAIIDFSENVSKEDAELYLSSKEFFLSASILNTHVTAVVYDIEVKKEYDNALEKKACEVIKIIDIIYDKHGQSVSSRTAREKFYIPAVTEYLRDNFSKMINL